MEFNKIIQTVIVLLIVLILSKIYISIFSKIFRLYIDDIKKRIKLKNNYVFFCYPHTSYYDGLFSISSSLIVSLFSNHHPLFPIAQHQGIPSFIKKYTFLVGKDKNQTQKLVDFINNKQGASLYISPEGTRKYRDKIKKGFYYIAKDTNLPIVCTTINFRNMKTHYSHPIYVKNKSIKLVMKEIKAWYSQFYLDDHSIYPEYRAPLKI